MVHFLYQNICPGPPAQRVVRVWVKQSSTGLSFHGDNQLIGNLPPMRRDARGEGGHHEQ